MRTRLSLALVGLAAASCSPAASPPAPAVPPPPAASASPKSADASAKVHAGASWKEAKAGTMHDGMDPSVPPGADFFRFANGGWLASTEIPKDRSSWGVGAQVAELTDARTAKLIREVA